MSNQQNQNRGFNPQQPSFTTTTGGKNPKQIHIAHRRSPSELTNLMMEQIALQRQLEIVQAQQQQILAQQGGHQQHQQQQQQQQHQHQLSGSYSAAAASGPSNTSASSSLQPPASMYHNRTGSNTHKRSQSSVTGAMGSFSLQNNLAPPPKFGNGSGPGQSQQGSSPLGHSRRHSLGLNEAKRAAAQVQAQRAGKDTATVPQDDDSQGQPSASMPPPSGFKFPSTVVEPPRSQQQQQLSSTPRGHGRSRSMAPPQSPQRSYQFPPKSPSSTPQQFDLLAPPQPQQQQPQQQQQQGSFHDRRQSGHFRSNSRNLDMNQNWRQRSPQRGSQYENDLLAPPPQFTPGHRSRGSHGGNSISSMAGFQMQGGGQNSNGRKSLFAPYLPQSSIPELVSDGHLVVGTLRVNKKNRSDAYVSTDGLLDADIFICGSKDRNRALEGDLVAVELLSVDEVWSSKREKEEKKRRKDNNSSGGSSNVAEIIDDVHNDASTHGSAGAESAGSSSSTARINSSGNNSNITNNNSTTSDKSDAKPSLQRRGSLKQRPTLKKNDDVEVEGQSLLLVEEEEISDEYKPLYAGHVVAVIDRIPGQLFAGTLGLLRPSQHAKEQQHPQQRPKIVWFKPTDKKVPLIAIPTEQAPKDFVESVDKYTNKLFVASIKRWPITSLHPFGTLISELGPMNDSNIEVDALLRDNNFLCEEYLNNDTGLEKEDFELIPVDLDTEFSKRRDFSGEYVLAVSETGATSDHSVHVKRISDDKIELGVHISDVAAFIKEGSLLDKSARKRSSSVFLAQKTVHLFPQVINELLSFKKNEKKLSVSVVFEIDTTKFEVDDVWIGESFVQPKNLLTYDEIDAILTNKSTSSSSPSTADSASDTSSASKDYIKTISLISREFRRQRLENSKLNNEINLTLLDQVDDEKVRLDLNLFKSSLCSSIFNELFLKVNGTVAQRNYAILGDSAFLRRHTMPALQKLETFKRKANSMGVEIDTNSPASILNSIMAVEDITKRQAIEILFYKALTRSKYFVAGKVDPENYGAFYFNLPLYTHFTAPLRRYADSIVHRQLKAALNKSGGASNSNVDVGGLPSVASITGFTPSSSSSPISEDDAGDSLSSSSYAKNVSTIDDLESLKMTAEYCNFKKDCAKAAQDQSVHLLLSQTINEMCRNTGQLIVMGTVLQVYESAFDVYLPGFGIEKRVHGDQLPLKKAEFDKKNMVLELYWENGVDTATYIPDDEREPLSYRNSIKNKFKTSSIDIAKSLQLGKENVVSNDLANVFAGLKLTPPQVSLPQHGSSSSSRGSSSSSALDEYLKSLKIRVEGGDYIQEIRELEQVPILLRAEIGMALPCLTVHALNPFTNVE